MSFAPRSRSVRPVEIALNLLSCSSSRALIPPLPSSSQPAYPAHPSPSGSPIGFLRITHPGGEKFRWVHKVEGVWLESESSPLGELLAEIGWKV